VFENAARVLTKSAVIDGQSGEALTYDALIARSRQMAAVLTKRGLRKGQVCAIYAPNVLDYIPAFYAIGLAGGVATTINPLYSSTELNHQLRDSRAHLLITTPTLAAVAREAVVESNVDGILHMSAGPTDQPFSLIDVNDHSIEVDERHEVDPRVDVVALPYSSGTTGLPKGVMLTHYNLVANLQQTHAVERLGADEVLIGSLPFYHIYGMTMLMMYALRIGATVITHTPFTVKGFLELVQKYRVTTAYVVPPIVRTLATHPLVDMYDLSSLKDVVSAAAPLPEPIARACIDRLRCSVRQAYGMTEASPMTHFLPRGIVRFNAVGVPIPNTERRIVDVGDGTAVTPGDLGEVWVRGPQVMKGYLNNPEATAAMIDPEGWLHTGDIGFVDSEGILHVLDRAKELTKFRGLHYTERELLLSMVEELVARRQAEKSVRFQALLLDSVRESVIATDRERRVTFWNHGAEDLFGYTRQEALGQSIELLIFPQDSDIDSAAWAATLEQSGGWHGQVKRRHKKGSFVWADVRASVIRDADGQRSGTISIHRDITELKRNEEMLRDSREQLRNLASRLIDVREDERAAMAREMHDELGQSLTRQKIDVCWLLDRLPKRLQTSRALSLATSVDSMLESVQRLSARLRPAILDDLGLEAAIELEAQQAAKICGCRCELDLRIDSLRSSRDRDTAIFRIVQEALTNVVRHSHARRVRVRARLLKRSLALQVADDGVGMARQRLADTRSLGLIGMRERAEAIGGDVRLTSSHGKGTVVSVRVPIEAARVSSRMSRKGASILH
jgi:PAS domain S-box-containing protein